MKIPVLTLVPGEIPKPLQVGILCVELAIKSTCRCTLYYAFYSIRFQLFSILGTNVKHTLNGPHEAKHLISKRSRSLEAIVIESDNEKLYGSLELKERSLLLNGVRLKSSARRLNSNDNYNTGIGFC